MQARKEALARLVRSVWSLAGSPDEAALPGIIVPDAHVEFVFHLGARWRMRRIGDSDWTEQPSAFVYAQQVGGLILEPGRDVSLIAFRVTPVVARRILGWPTDDLWDRPVCLESLVGGEALRLLEDLHRAASLERFAVLRRWIAQRLRDWDAADWRAQALFNALLWRSRAGSIADNAQALGLSSHSLRRILESAAGLSPKSAQLSGRVLAACALLRERPELDITEVANQVGFYDHAAFTHSFVSRIGITPSRLRRERGVVFEHE